MKRTTRTSGRVFSGVSPWLILAGLAVVVCIVGGLSVFGKFAPSNPVADAVKLPTLVPTTAAEGPTAAPISDEPVTSLARANVFRGAWYTLFFTKPEYPEKKENRSGGIDHAIVADFERAQKTIDAAVFDVRLPSLVDSLARAAQRGVRVRMVVDYQANKDAPDFTNAITKLEQAGVQLTRNHRSALMHDKFAVIDNRLLWTGSMNFTPNDAYRNNNNMLRIENPALQANYSQIFERLFQQRAPEAPSKIVPNPRIDLGSGVIVENYFSPGGGAQKAILDKLKAAQKNIRITAFSFTDTKIGDALQARHKEKIPVQIVTEARNNSGVGAEYAGLKRAGLDILEDGNCYILHSKTIVIDDRIVITGSYNYTDNANKSNDENLLIIDDPTLAKHYVDEFNRIYRQAQNPTKCGSDPTLTEPLENTEQ